MSRFVLAPIFLVLLSGCTGEIGGNTEAALAASPSDAAGARTTALVIVERSVSPTDVSTGAASARFIQYPSSVSQYDAVRRIGATVELPPLGTCAALTAIASAGGSPDALSDDAPIQLLDVGTVVLFSNGIRTELQPRHLPDLTDLAYGVVYSRVTESEALGVATGYQIELGAPSAQAAAVPGTPLRFSAKAPGDFTELTALGAPLLHGEPLVLPNGSSLPLEWKRGAPGDVVYVDLRPLASMSAAGPGQAFVRCAFADEGAGVVPSSSLVFDDFAVTIHRLHEEAVASPSFDTGEVRFDFAQTIAIVRR